MIISIIFVLLPVSPMCSCETNLFQKYCSKSRNKKKNDNKGENNLKREKIAKKEEKVLKKQEKMLKN